MTEEEATRLDKGLSAVFQSMKKTNSKKKSKKERIIATTVMHFRIRALDLIETYLKSTPSMEICLEIMLAMFSMMELCVEGDLKPLSVRVEKVLNKLLSLRNFENVTNVDEEHLCKLLNQLMDRKVNPGIVDTFNKMLSKSLAFIVSNIHLVDNQNDGVLTAMTKYASEFLTTRNPKMNFTLLKDIFKLRWTGVWSIGVSLVEHLDGKNQNLRSFRRIQLFELLGLLYKNHGFITQDPKALNERNRTIVARISNYLDNLKQTVNVHPKEFSSLVALLCEMYKCSRNVELKIKIDWESTGEQVQDIRQKLVLPSPDSYQTFCKLLGIKVTKNSDVQIADRNGHGSVENGTSETVEHQNNKKKRKLQEAAVDVEQESVKVNKKEKKQKKLSKEERLRIASEGLNGISFANVAIDDVEMESNSDSE